MYAQLESHTTNSRVRDSENLAESWGTTEAVNPFLDTWPDVSAKEALSFVITSTSQANRSQQQTPPLDYAVR